MTRHTANSFRFLPSLRGVCRQCAGVSARNFSLIIRADPHSPGSEAENEGPLPGVAVLELSTFFYMALPMLKKLSYDAPGFPAEVIVHIPSLGAVLGWNLRNLVLVFWFQGEASLPRSLAQTVQGNSDQGGPLAAVVDLLPCGSLHLRRSRGQRIRGCGLGSLLHLANKVLAQTHAATVVYRGYDSFDLVTEKHARKWHCYTPPAAQRGWLCVGSCQTPRQPHPAARQRQDARSWPGCNACGYCGDARCPSCGYDWPKRAAVLDSQS